MRYKIGMTIGVLLILIWCLLPVVWIISLSVKSEESITAGNPGFLPSEGTSVGLDNYDKVLTDPLYDYFPRAIIN
jgi:multiple sugar transport system permease protein